MPNRLTIARRASAAPGVAASCLSDELGARSKGPRVCINIVMSKILHSGVFADRAMPLVGVWPPARFKGCENLSAGLGRFRHVAPPMAHYKTDQQSKPRDERIAFVLEVEFKPLG